MQFLLVLRKFPNQQSQYFTQSLVTTGYKKIKHPLLRCDSRAFLLKSYVQSLIAENHEIDKSHQTAIRHVERSKEAHTSGFFFFFFFSKVLNCQTRRDNAVIFDIFRLSSKKNAVRMLPQTSFVTRHVCMC